jgi:hypothetical protein
MAQQRPTSREGRPLSPEGFEEPPSGTDYRALAWPIGFAVMLVLGMGTASFIAWSPWNGGEEAAPIQGGSDTPVPIEQTVEPPATPLVP